MQDQNSASTIILSTETPTRNLSGTDFGVEGIPFTLEKIYDYEPGGHHPVHLGDHLNIRYKVVHKLGSGGFANIWLCRDVSSEKPRYVALKILIAEESTHDCSELRVHGILRLRLDQDILAKHFCLPLDHFEINGPNGLHYVFVYPVLGPRVSKLRCISKTQDPGHILRNMCLQVTQAMTALHDHQICHGDFQPANILVRISGIDGSAEGDVLGALGVPQKTPVLTQSGEAHNSSMVPQYLVYPIDWDDICLSTLGQNFITDNACVIDFGESYDMSKPPAHLGITQPYCAPEYTLENEVGVGCDLWALGCTLFEIRTGRQLFSGFDDEQDDCLYRMAMILGKFPEPWWSSSWEARKDTFEDEEDMNGRVVEIHQNTTVADSTLDGLSEQNGSKVVFQKEEPRSLRESLADGLFYEDQNGPENIHWDIPEPEVNAFSELLALLLKYNPKDRLKAREALHHRWFHLDME